MTNTITIEPVTRIEGHAKITLHVSSDGFVTQGNLHVLEVRGFERLLEGMELFKIPLVTARICGVCPAAHLLASVQAIENGLGIDVPRRAAMLRELMYLGHILHSHALSCFVLTGPDLLTGLDAAPEKRNIFSLLNWAPKLAKKMLRLRSIGQRLVEMIGGRGVHPITTIAGGITSAPSASELDQAAQWGIEVIDIIDKVYPIITQVSKKLVDIRKETTLNFFSLALSNCGKIDFLKGSLNSVNQNGNFEKTFNVGDYTRQLIEHVMPGSYMKSVRFRNSQEHPFIVGPLARINVNEGFGTFKADKALLDFKGVGMNLSPLDAIEARLIEMIYCGERIKQLAESVGNSGELLVEATPGAGRFVGVVEAPRGVLIHDYTANELGKIETANLIVATQNNYDAINCAITKMAQYYYGKADDNLFANSIEFILRCFDPCLACATHASGKMPLSIEIHSNGCLVRTISKRSS